VSFCLQLIQTSDGPALGPTFASASGSGSGSGSGSAGISTQQSLVTALEIPPELVGPANGSLQNSYRKFKAYHEATAKLAELVKDGSWQGPKPTQGAIKDLFCSRSFFSSHFTKFNKITDYPDLQKWLEDHPEKKSDLEVWKLKKDKYGFGDIDTFVAQKGTLVVTLEESEGEGDVKGKGKERKSGKGKKIEKGKKSDEGDKDTGRKKRGGKKVEVEKTTKKASGSSRRARAK
jgi:hypothetical protein